MFFEVLALPLPQFSYKAEIFFKCGVISFECWVFYWLSTEVSRQVMPYLVYYGYEWNSCLNTKSYAIVRTGLLNGPNDYFILGIRNVSNKHTFWFASNFIKSLTFLGNVFTLPQLCFTANINKLERNCCIRLYTIAKFRIIKRTIKFWQAFMQNKLLKFY